MEETDKLVNAEGWPLVALNDGGIRPAGSPDGCFYCGANIGQPHGRLCVMVEKRVQLRYSFVVDVMVPHHWTKDDIERHRNESSWCADNAITELHVDGSCLCPRFKAEFVRVLDETPQRELQEKHHPSDGSNPHVKAVTDAH